VGGPLEQNLVIDHLLIMIFFYLVYESFLITS